jgi:hypothetical protein
MPSGRVAGPLPTQKKCSLCDAVKPATDFYSVAYTTPIGTRLRKLKPGCKACETIKRLARYRETYVPHPRQYEPPKVRDAKAERLAKRLANPEQFRAYEAKYREGRRSNPEQNQADQKLRADWYQANKERVRIRNKKFRDANLEKVRLRYLAAIYKKVARGCDKRKKSIQNAIAETLASYRVGDLYWDVYSSELIAVPTIDHIVPLASGGGNDVDNFCVTSKANNTAKNRTPLLVWLLKRPPSFRPASSAAQSQSNPEAA